MCVRLLGFVPWVLVRDEGGGGMAQMCGMDLPSLWCGLRRGFFR